MAHAVDMACEQGGVQEILPVQAASAQAPDCTSSDADSSENSKKKPLRKWTDAMRVALFTQVQAERAYSAKHGEKGPKWKAVAEALGKHPTFTGVKCHQETMQKYFWEQIDKHQKDSAQRAVEHKSGSDDERVTEETRLLDDILESIKCDASAKDEAAAVKSNKSKKQIEQGALVREASMTGAAKRRKRSKSADAIDIDGDDDGKTPSPSPRAVSSEAAMEAAICDLVQAMIPNADDKAQEREWKERQFKEDKEWKERQIALQEKRADIEARGQELRHLEQMKMLSMFASLLPKDGKNSASTDLPDI